MGGGGVTSFFEGGEHGGEGCRGRDTILEGTLL